MNIGFYFRIYKIKAELLIGLLMVLKYFYFVVPALFKNLLAASTKMLPNYANFPKSCWSWKAQFLLV
jgi:hypothetical protein